MKKLALLAMLALVVGFVPMATAGSQVEAQADGTVKFINAFSSAPIDICLDGDTLIDDLALGTGESVDLPGGNQAIAIAINPATTCAAPAFSVTGGINVVGGQQVTAIITGPTATQGVNDTSTTPADTTRLIIRSNGTLGPFGICVDGALVDGTTPVAGGQVQVEVPSGPVTQSFNIGGVCNPDTEAEVTYAPCTALELNVFGVEADPPLAVVSELFIVGCELPTSDQNLTEFCLVVNPGLQDASSAIDALFAGVKAPNPETYPSPDEVQAVVDLVNAAIAAGDATVPDTIRPQWEIVTSGLRQLVAGLTAASFDFDTIGQAGIQEILDGMAEGPDAETQAAIDVLTDFYVANCLISGEPTFTG